MQVWKIVSVVAIVGAGFWVGYLVNGGKKPSEPRPVATAPPAAPVDSELLPPGYDPALVLPPPSAKGVLIDPPIDVIRAHFETKLTTDQEPPLLDAPPFLPRPIIRLPAPDEEPVRRAHFLRTEDWMFVSKRDLKLNFDIMQRGTSGIQAVELWARRSPQNEYECVDRLEGDQAPFSNRLGSEGLYEFRMVAIGGAGTRGRKPNRLEPPDLQVCLDLTPPVIGMLPPEAAEAGAMKLRWSIEETHLDENSIELEYSLDGTEWKPITTEMIANTGSYVWTLPEGVTEQLQVRASARDKAGNKGRSTTTTKFVTDLIVPTAKITGFLEELVMPRIQ